MSHCLVNKEIAIRDSVTPSNSSPDEVSGGSKPPCTTVQGQFQRRLNLIIFGMDEYSKETPRHVRKLKDHSISADILSSIDPQVTSNSISDCFRLGKFKPTKPCPVLVRLTRSVDVSYILSKRNKLASLPGISVKPDLPLDERKTKSVLLKERRLLIDFGVNSSDIKLCLFVKKSQIWYGQNF